MRNSLSLFAILSLAGPTVPALAETPKAEVTEKAQFDRALQMVMSGKPKEAIPLLDAVIAANQARHADPAIQVYCARGPAETLMYMAESAARGRSAVAVGDTWCDALFFKGYALFDLGQREESRRWIERAVAMAPHNAHYKGELAESYKAAREWGKAYALFAETAEDARVYSPDDIKNFDLRRALRGMGFVLIEMGKFDEATAKFEECLKLDPDDQKAKGELRFIEEQKAKKAVS
ncbi:MAG: tetratricopeptide repeat protein [Sphingomicrobium sp.]